MDKQEETAPEMPANLVTCSGGIVLPSLEVLFGQRPQGQEDSTDGE
jgi:hypothetical protein